MNLPPAPWKQRPSKQPNRQLDILLRWLYNNGARFPKLHLGYDRHGNRGGFAQTRIVANDSVLSVPINLIITIERAKATPVGRYIQSALPHTNGAAYLAVFLLYESRRANSFWRPYLDILPISHSYLPVCWGSEDLEQIQGTFVHRRATESREAIEGEYAELRKKVPGFSRFSLKAYLWARLAVYTRSFRLRLDGQPVTAGLVPLGDMLNHRNPCDAPWREDISSPTGPVFRMVARWDVERGTELFTTYGSLNGTSLLSHFGFYPPEIDEEQESMEVVLGFNEQDSADTRRNLLELGTYSARRHVTPLKYDSDMMKDVLAYLRIAWATPEELGELASHPKPHERARSPLSMATEARALQELAKGCEQRLSQFPTTNEEDLRLLEDTSLSYLKRSCIRVRLSEKRRLQRCLDLVRTWEPLLHRPSKERLQQADKLVAEAGHMADYVRRVLIATATPTSGEPEKLGLRSARPSIRPQPPVLARHSARAMSLTRLPWKPPPEKQRERALATYLRWLHVNGARFPKLHLGYDRQGQRRTFARAPLSAREPVLSVPYPLMITLERAMGSSVGRVIQATLPNSSPGIYLTAYLLHENRRRHSFWRPYLDLLPGAYPHLPMCYSNEQRALLTGCFVQRRCTEQRESMAMDYAQLCKRIPGFSRFSYEAYLWARLAVMTRSFRVGLGEKQTLALVPLADMVNHNTYSNLGWTASFPDPSKPVFEMVASQELASGTALYTSYGFRQGSQLLTRFGFYPSEPEEEQEEFEVVLGIEEDSLSDIRRKLLGLGDYTARRYVVPLNYENPSTKAMFAYLRIAWASPDELRSLASHPQPLERAQEPLSRDTEAKVLKALAAACEARFPHFATTIEEDERILQEEPLTAVARGCIAMRLAEKRRLRRCLELVRTWEPMLHLPQPERRKAVDRVLPEAGLMASYLRPPPKPALASAA